MTTVTSTPGIGDYVTQVNALCAQLMTDVIAVTGDAEPTLESFVSHPPRLTRIYEAFDDEATSNPVSAADEAAADTLDAFREFSDESEAQLAEAAETGDPAKFDAAYDAIGEAIHSSTWKEDLSAVGIRCPAR